MFPQNNHTVIPSVCYQVNGNFRVIVDNLYDLGGFCFVRPDSCKILVVHKLDLAVGHQQQTILDGHDARCGTNLKSSGRGSLAHGIRNDS